MGTDAEYGYNAALETHDVAWLASEVRLQVMRREQAERDAGEARLEAARTAETILTEVATHLRHRATNPRVVSGKYRVEGWLQAVDAMERAGHGRRQFWETATAQAEARRTAPQPAAGHKGDRLVVRLNSNVTTSRGKAAAQAVHAALELLGVHHGGPVIVLGGKPAEIEAMTAVIHDAGRTELAPGTLTAGAEWQTAETKET